MNTEMIPPVVPPARGQELSGAGEVSSIADRGARRNGAEAKGKRRKDAPRPPAVAAEAPPPAAGQTARPPAAGDEGSTIDVYK